MKCFRFSTAGVVVMLAVVFCDIGLAQSTNGVLREVFSITGGSTISALTNSPNYPSNPSLEEVLTQYIECPNEYSDNYGTRLRGLLTPPVTGTYYFYISSDDQGHLYLSTDENPTNKRLIATVNGWTSSREYNKEANQKSAGITLVGGQRYYLEALQSEGGGGDNLAVAWQKPGDQPLSNGALPIPASYAVPYGLGPPIIISQPQNTAVTEGGTAVFSVSLARNIGAVFQWQRNGINIPAATSATVVFGPVTLADSGSTFRCYITNALGWTNSISATLTVNPDRTAPTLMAAGTLGSSELISVQFSEPVEPASATNAANYGLSGGFSVLQAVFGPDSQTIVLRTTPMVGVASVTLTVNNIRDRATTPNTIAANTSRLISLGFTPLETPLRWPGREPAGPSERSGPLAISEIMYHPTNRADGRNLEFVEIYNSQAWPEEIGGFRLTGAVEYTFPANTVIASGARVVVAAVPADLQAVYGLTNVHGPFSGRLQNEGGTLRLRNHLDAVLVEVEYSDDAPWPAAADGGGHSLVLARPSYGANDSRAWAASERLGGSPGTDEPVLSNGYRTIMINEVLASAGSTNTPYVELYNYGSTAINLAGCVLTDDPATNKYTFPTGSTLAAMGFRALTTNELGFALDAGGQAIYLIDAARIRVIDALKYGGQDPDVPWGRYPDGAPEWYALAVPSRSQGNLAPKLPLIVINEIMFDPIAEDNADEFVELFNPGTNAVDLGQWKIRGEVNINFPNPTLIPGGGFLVVGADIARLRAKYSVLDTHNSLGNFSGSLANGGGTLRLEKKVRQYFTNDFGFLDSREYDVVMHQVRYQAGGRWPQWANGGGSSLELIDPRADGLRAAAWAGSDETASSGWVTIEHTGILDNGQATADSLQVFLLGPGECLVDNVEVIPAGGSNLVGNPDFESGTEDWFFQGTHYRSGWAQGRGYGSQNSLHVRSTSRGDTGANRIRTRLTRTLNAGETATIRARVKWLCGHPQILLRLRGSFLEATGNILTTTAFGTPGQPNRAAGNAPPAVSEVTHSPVLPTAGQVVKIVAKVQDADGLSALYIRYRVDPATNWNTVIMAANGAGYFSATLPGQSSGAMVAYYIVAADFQGAVSRFPNDAPERECLIRWGETTPAGSLGVYRLWITQKTLNQWIAREKLSNDALDATFVYGGARVIYNAGGEYSGSPWHSPGFSSPVSGFCDYGLSFPPDDRLLGSTELTLQWPGNGGGDGTAQGEQHAYWLGYQLGLPYCHRRTVHFYLNGNRRGDPTIEDVQQPNKQFVEEWYPQNEQGDLHKVQIWFEFDDAASSFSAVGASLGNWTTTGGQKKMATYRWLWSKRAYGNDANNYTNFYRLIDTVNTSATGANYTRAIEAEVDVDAWARHFLVEKLVGNWDSYGNGGGQNMFIYKPGGGTWKFFIWDIDFAFYSGGPTDDLFSFSDGPLSRLFSHPPFLRAYWRAIKDAADGPLQASRSNTILDQRYNAFRANGINASAPDGIKNFISGRLQYLTGTVLPRINATFSVTSLPLGNWSTNRNLLTLSGTAPVEVQTILINGQPVPVQWTSVTNWTLNWALSPGANQLIVSAVSHRGVVVAATTNTITYTGVPEAPGEVLAINEIMHQPAWPEAGFVELHNRSQVNAFDLSNWRLHGVDFNFAPGTIIQPGGFLVVTKNQAAFNSAYGASAAVAGEFSGRLDTDGETLRLEKSGASGSTMEIIDEVAFENAAPWPLVAANEGASLQLLDAAQDNGRAANWAAVSTNQQAPPQWRFISASGVAGSGVIYVYLQSAGDCYIDDLKLVAGSTPEVGANLLNNGDFESALSGSWTISANHSGSHLITTVKRAGSSSLHLVASSGGTTRDSSIWQDASSRLTAGQTYTLSFWYLPGASGGPLTIRFSGSWIRLDANLASTQAQRATPGAPNSVSAKLPPFPPLWLNEVQPQNASGPMDRFGEREPWVELFNGGTNLLSLNGFYLANNYSNLTQWAFPADAVLAAGQFLTVWLDGEPAENIAAELHANFRLNAPTGALALAQVAAGKTSLVHHLNFRVPGPDRSYGLYPDGRAGGRQGFALFTPGNPNSPAFPAVRVFINEWMANNISAIVDPADGVFEDWFELYNAGSEAADLSGYYLTDNPTNRFLWSIPSGAIIPPGGFLRIWADGEPEQYAGGDLHAGFKLSASGESIGLYAPDGTLVDLISFTEQVADRSEGRFPDGSDVLAPFVLATPGGANILESTNLPPVFSPIGPRTVAEGTLLTFDLEATDPDAGQTLTFVLGPGAPSGATVSTSGVFSWYPSEAQGGVEYVIEVRVFDNGIPRLWTSQNFTVAVEKANSAPQLTTTGDYVIYEGELFSFIAGAVDVDEPVQQLTFSLAPGSPAGASIKPGNGLFVWQPDESQGPGNYLVTVRVTDNGTPPMTDEQTIRIGVLESNQPPVFAALPARVAVPGYSLSFNLAATDADWPAQTLAYDFAALPPAGVTLSPAGVFEWTPDQDQENTTNVIQVRVTDDGSPSRSAVTTFNVIVMATNRAPVVQPITNVIAIVGMELAVTNLALDDDQPLQQLTWAVLKGPTNAVLNAQTGVWCWQPDERFAGSTQTVVLVASDDGLPSLSATQRFAVAVLSSEAAPALAASQFSTSERAVLEFRIGPATNAFGEVLNYVVIRSPINGTLIPLGGNRFQYLPHGYFNGLEVFEVGYQINGVPVRTAPVAVSVGMVNDVAPQLFEWPVVYRAGAKPGTVAVGDFNRDKYQDVVSANTAGNSLSLLLGDGAGKLKPPVELPLNGWVAGVAAADLNHDNRLDLAVAGGGDNRVSLLLGDGTGRFSAPAHFVAGRNPVAVATGDFDQDLNMDIVVANSEDHTINLLFGNGVGGVRMMVTYATGTQPVALAVADFNNDSRPDVAVANYSGNTVRILWGGIGGAFLSQQNLATGRGPRALAVADFNGDGRKDLAVAHSLDSTVVICLSTAAGTMTMTNAIWVGGTPAGLAATDFNRDGQLDLVVSDWLENSLKVLPGQGGGQFQYYYQDSSVYIPLTSLPVGLAVADFNQDTHADLAVAQWGSDEVTVLLNNYQPRVAPLKVTALEDWPVEIRLRGTTGLQQFHIAGGPTNGTLRLKQAPDVYEYLSVTNASGRDVIEYYGYDGQRDTASDKIAILIMPVNDPPTLELVTNRLVFSAAAMTQSAPLVNRNNSTAGPANEAGQALRFMVSNPRRDFFRVQPSISSNGQLSLQPNGIPGVVEIEVHALDSGGTAYGGTNASPRQTVTIELMP